MIHRLEKIGRATANAIEEMGFAASLLLESLYWLVLGRSQKQPVRLSAIAAQGMEIGVLAIPIVTMMAATIGMMLAIQGIYTLKTFGAENQVVLGVSISITREFAPLITGIIVAGRSGSALAARLGSMKSNQELDALEVMGISPVRFLVAPALLSTMILMPLITFWADIAALMGAGLYVSLELGMSLGAFVDQCLSFIAINDLFHGLGKSIIFAILIVVIGVVNGASVEGGAEGVGHMTTRSVVHSISAIVLTDMLFALVVTR